MVVRRFIGLLRGPAKASLFTSGQLIMEHGPISFPDWKQVLARAGLELGLRGSFEREIIAFLRHCKAGHTPATVELAKHYLARRERQTTGPAHEALRWFFRKGRGSPAISHSVTSEATKEVEKANRFPVETTPRGRIRAMEPPPAAGDVGAEPWERGLIKTLRERGLLWRTEQTYREWAVRFARFIAPRSPYAASGEDVAAFLSALAVQGRASSSAQKQAFRVKAGAHAG